MNELPVTWESFPTHFVRAFAALFPLVNPFAVAPVFLELTAEHTAADRARLATRACVIAGVLMLVTMVLGELFMKVLGVSLPAVRIATGLIIAYMGFGLLFARTPLEIPTIEATRRVEDYAFIPIGFPGLSGAGALSAMIAFATLIGSLPSSEEKTVGNLIALASVVVVCLVSWLILRVAAALPRKTANRHGWIALGRAMGILKVCIGIQLAANGVKGMIESARALL